MVARVGLLCRVSYVTRSLCIVPSHHSVKCTILCNTHPPLLNISQHSSLCAFTGGRHSVQGLPITHLRKFRISTSDDLYFIALRSPDCTVSRRVHSMKAFVRHEGLPRRRNAASEIVPLPDSSRTWSHVRAHNNHVTPNAERGLLYLRKCSKVSRLCLRPYASLSSP